MGVSSSFHSKLNVGEKDELEVKGYRPHRWKWTVPLLATILTFGLFLVVLAWRKDVRLALFYQTCALHEATKILIKASLFQVHILK